MIHYGNDYISYIENVDSEYHRSHWIIHRGGTMFYFAEFDNKDQLDMFARTLGFTYELVEDRKWRNTNTIYREYKMSKNIVEPCGFWKLEDLPQNVKPIKALSNGSIVTCYYRTLDNKIEFFRPNPNAKEVYNPLNTDLHIAHRKIYGLY